MEVDDRSHLHLWNVAGMVGRNRETALVIAATVEEARERAEVERLRGLGSDLRAAIPADLGRQEVGELRRIADELERKS